MKRSFIITVLCALALFCGCSAQPAEQEIFLPILDENADDGFTTAAAERYDVEEYVTIGASVDHTFAETIPVPCDTNVLEYNVRKGDRLSAGDIIAVFDSSSFDYELRNQQIAVNDAYSRSLASGSELDRLGYEQEQLRLELVQSKIDACTIRAPYDCVIWGTEPLRAGDSVSEGSPVCRIASPDEVYVAVRDHTELFAFGMPVKLKFGTSSTFSGKVAMLPDNSIRGGINSVLIKLDEGELERADEEAGNIAAAGWASVIVTDYRAYNVLCVPEDAVMTYSGETYCYIEENGERARIPVEAGKTVNGLTVVTSGLSDGDIVSF